MALNWRLKKYKEFELAPGIIIKNMTHLKKEELKRKKRGKI